MKEQVNISVEEKITQQETIPTKAWRYGKQIIKGAMLLGVGLLGYVSLKRFTRKEEDKNERLNTQPVEKHNQVDRIKKDPTHSEPLLTKRSDSHRVKRSSSDKFMLNNVTRGSVANPTSTALTNGNFVVVWEESIGSIGGQIIDSSGNKLNAFTLGNSSTSYKKPAMTSLIDGNFVVVFNAGGGKLLGQRLAPSGSKIENEFRINSDKTRVSTHARIASQSYKGFVVVWTYNRRDYYKYDLTAQLFDVSSNKIGQEILSLTGYLIWSTFNYADETFDIAAFQDGKFAVTRKGGYGNFDTVQYQVFTSSGETSTNLLDTITNTFDSYRDMYTGDQISISILNEDAFVITWHVNFVRRDSKGGIENRQYSVVANRYDKRGSGGLEAKPESLAPILGGKRNTGFYYPQQPVRTVSTTLPGSSYLVAGADISGQLQGQAYNKFGQKIGSNSVPEAGTSTSKLALAANPSGRVLVTWQASNLYAKIYEFAVSTTLQKAHSYIEDKGHSFSKKPITVDLTNSFTSLSSPAIVGINLTLSDKTAGALSAQFIGSARWTFDESVGLWQGTGPVEEVNNMLGTLRFVPALNYNTNFTITISGGVIPAKDFTDVISMSGMPVNDPPVITKNRLLLTSGERVKLTSNDLSATDVD